MSILDKEEYSFLHNDFFQKHEIVLLAYGGSHAYGLSTPTSDIDIRGIAMNTESELLGTDSFEQFTDNKTDTVIYSFNKAIKLLVNCNLCRIGCKCNCTR